MAKHQKDIKGWEILLGEKAEGRHMRQKIVSKNSGITLHRTSDDLEIKEGDCVSFNLKNGTSTSTSDYKVVGLGFIKDITFAVDKFLAVRILWFVKYNDNLAKILPELPNGDKYTLNDLFLTPFLDSIFLDQIVKKHNVIGINQLKSIVSSPQPDLNKLENTYVCRRFTNDSTTYFTDIIDWDTLFSLFKENKNEFFDTLKILTVKPAYKKSIKAMEKNNSLPNSPIKREEIKSIKKELLGNEDIDIYQSNSDHDYHDDGDDDSYDDYSNDDNDDNADNIISISDDNDDDEYKEKHTSSPKKRKSMSNKTSTRKRSKMNIIPQLPFVDNDSEIILDSGNTTTNMLVRAKKILGTDAKLKSLPCREDEFYQLYHNLESAVKSQKGCCIYVSGTPGVGKTATIREVIKQLSAKTTIESNGEKMFNYIEINGLKLIKPQSAYEILWKKISNKSTSTSNSLNFLQQYFEDNQDGRDDDYDDNSDHEDYKNFNKLPLVVLLDELDQIVTRNQAVMYNFFNWPTYENSKLIVIAVANTMDLPERLLTNKISSRLGLSRIQFTSYSYNQLSEIIRHRLEQLSKNNSKLLIAKDAIEFASRKVASVSGDARRSLMICIRAVEIAEIEFLNKSEIEREELDGKFTVTIMHIMKAVNETSTSPIIGYLNSLSFLSKLILACIMLRKKRMGIAEVYLGEVFDELSNQIQILLFSELKNKLSEEDLDILDIVYGNGNKKMNGSVINTSLYILKDLEENGILMMQNLKMERNKLIRLNISDDEILNCFKRDKFLKEMIIYTS